MKIAMIGTRGVPAHYGGFETAIEEIGSRLADAGHEVVVFCRPVDGEPQRARYKGMHLVHLPALRHRSLETLSHTALSVFHPALRHVDAAVLFNAANSPFLPVLRARGIPVATHVDGLEWRRSKWGPTGRRYYRAAEGLAVRWSDALIADARGIAEYYRAEFGVGTRQIAYGAPAMSDATDRLAELGLTAGEYHLVVARFEPENHVLEIVKGFVASSVSRPLVVVGSAPYSDRYSAELHQAADGRVRFLGGVWDQPLLDQLYVGARTYLHGHSVGGTNPSLLRAVGAGAPTIAFDCVFNREVLGDAGRYFSDAASLSAALDTLDGDDDQREGMAAGLPSIAARYRWDEVADRYLELFADLASRSVEAPRPSGRRLGPGWREPSDRRRTVLVAHPSPDLYGSDRVLLESVSAFVQAGLRTVVALPESGPLTDALEDRGADVTYVSSPVLRKSALRPAGFVRLVASAVASVAPTLRILRAVRPELVYVNTITIPLWVLVARLFGARVVCHVHEAESSAAPAVRRALYAPLLLAHRVLSNSDFSRDVIVSTWPRLGRGTHVLYNAVPGPACPPDPPREDPVSPRLLFLGRLSERKGPQVAIAALDDLRKQGVDATLTLLGSVFPGYESFARGLHRQVDALALQERVTFLGFDPDVWKHLAAADIVLVPSVVDEPFGNTAVEAMLSQRPLVVSDTSGLREAAGGYRTARFVGPGDAHSLATAVVDLLGSWPQVRRDVASDRDRARSLHEPSAYARRLIELCGLPGVSATTAPGTREAVS